MHVTHAHVVTEVFSSLICVVKVHAIHIDCILGNVGSGKWKMNQRRQKGERVGMTKMNWQYVITEKLEHSSVLD